MRVLLTNSNLYIEEATKEESDLLYETLSFRVPGAYFVPAYRNGHWDGYKHFYNRKHKVCDAGFLEVLIELTEKYKFELDIEDGRSLLKRPLIFKSDEWHEYLKSTGMNAHEYISKLQAVAAGKGLRRYAADGIPWKRGIFCIATGGGKTSLAGNLIKQIDKKTLFMLGRIDLMYQTKEVLESIIKKEVGIVGDTERNIQQTTILMSQTASRLLSSEEKWFIKWIKSIKVVILDEAHHLNDNTIYDITKKCTNAYYKFAFTATALKRHDPGDAQLIGAFGSKIVDIKSKKLRNKGALAKVVTWIYEFDEDPLPKNTKKKEAKTLGIRTHTKRHQVIISLAKRFQEKKWPCLILVDPQLSHGETLAQEFGLMSEEVPPVINYKTPKAQRRKLLGSLEDQKISIIIASIGIFGEGINAPNIRALIRAEGGDNEIRTLQAAGRGMRRKPHPNVLYLVDIWDQHHKLLEKDSRRRMSIYDEEEYDVRYITSADEVKFETKAKS